MRAYAKYLGFAALSGLVVSGIAYAAQMAVTANASFAAAVALVKVRDINFGVLQAGTPNGSRYIIDTAGNLTANAGGVIVGGAHNAAEITVTGAVGQTIAISVDPASYTANNGVTPLAATCNYRAVAVNNCDAGGQAGLTAPDVAGSPLLLGLTIETDGTQVAGAVATPSFTVNVVYG